MDPDDYMPAGADERCDLCGSLVDLCRCTDDEDYAR